MKSQRATAESRRAAARRLGANWTEFHRQEDEAARTSPLYDYVFRYLPGVVLTTAGVGIWHLIHGNALSILHVLTLGAAAAGGLVWAGSRWIRRRRAARARQVLYTWTERRGVRDRTT